MLWTFITVLVLVFALCLLIGGIFTAYFGSGKSRGLGVVLLIVGLIVGFGYGYVARAGKYLPASINLYDTIFNAVGYIAAAIIGAAIALGIFLLAIMKS